eukprot:TRINITY_DN14285_c0_g1_i1.p1 TRINITY_DN14285_c0_g1~~TRINITY_DN14285_c0_g1_i1.p1  ORF type:complete len:151 (-),score=35.76 TRINITY_DN14285_c0_g1_i1:357-752(-)
MCIRDRYQRRVHGERDDHAREVKLRKQRLEQEKAQRLTSKVDQRNSSISDRDPKLKQRQMLWILTSLWMRYIRVELFFNDMTNHYYVIFDFEGPKGESFYASRVKAILFSFGLSKVFSASSGKGSLIDQRN